MNSQDSICIIIFLCLFIASMLMQWVRAKARKKLVSQADPAVLPSKDHEKWLAIANGLDFMFKDFRKLQIAKRNLDRFPREFISGYRHYCVLSRIEMTVTITMLLFAVTAYRLCNYLG
jgi:hypothetical protein